MSWLSDIFGGGGGATHQQHADKVAADNAADAQKRAEALAAQKQAEMFGQAQSYNDNQNQMLADEKKSLFDTNYAGATDYFKNAGVDPTNYDAAIRSAIGSGGTGAGVFNELQDAYRQKEVGAFNEFAPTGFANTMIPGTADDEVIAKLIGEGRTGAEGYVNNLASRGLITNAGKTGAFSDLDAQQARIQGILSDLGTGILGGGRSNLEGIADQGRQAASGLTLGASFDPNAYKGQIDSALTDFMSGLEGTFRAQAPTDLFSTAGLQNKAGSVMGPQNTPFSSAALSGQTEDPDDEENRKQVVF